MARLVPNPIGDVTQPLRRIEAAIERLAGELEDIHVLPRIEAQLTDLNQGVTAMLTALEDLRVEIHAMNETAAGGDLAAPSR